MRYIERRGDGCDGADVGQFPGGCENGRAAQAMPDKQEGPAPRGLHGFYRGNDIGHAAAVTAIAELAAALAKAGEVET